MSDDYAYHVVDVFTKTRFKGNPLAVIPEADGLSGAQMMSIAAEFNLSETVFLVQPSNSGAAIRARIFTPRRELDFAGHPTIGAASVVYERMHLPQSFAIEENVGPVNIDCDTNESGPMLFWLTTPPVTFYESLQSDFCAALLGLSTIDLRDGVPPTFVSAGTPILFVCLRSPEAVDRAALQQQHLQGALGAVNSAGTFVFARKDPQSRDNFDVYARMFAPQNGIAEDPATGGATGPLAAYMMRQGLLPADRSASFISEQGTKMNRQSFLHVKTSPKDETIKVGGSAVPVARGVLNVNAG